MVTQSSLTAITEDTINKKRMADIENYKKEYQHLAQLKFSSAVEREFCDFREKQHIQQEKLTLTCGIFLYAMFFIADVLLVPVPMSYFAVAGRLIIVMFMMITIFQTFVKQTLWAVKYAQTFIAISLIMAGLHIIFVSACSPFPYDYQFLFGLIAVVITVPVLLKQNARLCAMVNIFICMAMMVYLFFIPADRVINTQWQVINNVLTNFPIFFSGFLISVGFLSVYMSYFFERMSRQQWLDGHISVLESEVLQELTEKFKLISCQDELTRIANRRYFFEKSTTIIEQYKRLNAPIAIIMLDVDFFKKYNDHYGHIAGDVCLRKIAHSLENSCRRTTDLIARYGGEEFVVLLTNANKQTAHKIAETIRQNINLLKIPHKVSDFGHITISLGVTSLICDKSSNIQSIIEHADMALYQAKNKGRNQVACYEATNL